MGQNLVNFKHRITCGALESFWTVSERVFHEKCTLYLTVAKLDMGKPTFEASQGGLFEILRPWEDFTSNELRFRKGMGELLRQKVRLEASPNGSPMSISENVCNVRVIMESVRW